MITIISKENYSIINKFNNKFNNAIYIIHFDEEIQGDDIKCYEDSIFVKNNTKEGLIKAIIDYKYSPEDINLILTNSLDIKTPGLIEYLNWVDYANKCASIIFDAPTLENAINAKIEEITKYDLSDAVNSFIYKGNTYWLDKATRVGLMNSTKILKEAGELTTTLWLDSFHVTFSVDDVIAMLGQLEMYALQCYNVTARHKDEVSKLTTIEDVENYDITVDYPSRIVCGE